MLLALQAPQGRGGGRNPQDFFPSLESRVALIGRIDSEAEGQGILGNVVLYYIAVSRRRETNLSGSPPTQLAACTL